MEGHRAVLALTASVEAMDPHVVAGAPTPRLVLLAHADLVVVVARWQRLGAQLAALRARLHEVCIDAAIVVGEVLALEALAGGVLPTLDALAVLTIGAGGLVVILAVLDLLRGGLADTACQRAIRLELGLVASRRPLLALEALPRGTQPRADALLVGALLVVLGLGRRHAGLACLPALARRLPAVVGASIVARHDALLDVRAIVGAATAVLVFPDLAVLASRGIRLALVLRCVLVQRLGGGASLARPRAVAFRNATVVRARVGDGHVATLDVLAIGRAAMPVLVTPPLAVHADGRIRRRAGLARPRAMALPRPAVVLACRIAGHDALADVVAVGETAVAIFVTPRLVVRTRCRRPGASLARLLAMARGLAAVVRTSVGAGEVALLDVRAVSWAAVPVLVLPLLAVRALLLLRLLGLCLGLLRRRRGCIFRRCLLLALGLHLRRGRQRDGGAASMGACGLRVLVHAGVAAGEGRHRRAVAAAPGAEVLADVADVRVGVAMPLRRDDGARHAADLHVPVVAAGATAAGADERGAREHRRALVARLRAEVLLDAVLLATHGDRSRGAVALAGKRAAALEVGDEEVAVGARPGAFVHAVGELGPRPDCRELRRAGRAVDVHDRRLVRDPLHDDDHLRGGVHEGPSGLQASVLLRGRVARHVDQLRVRGVLVLKHRIHARGLACGLPEGEVEVTGVLVQAQLDANQLARQRTGLRVEGLDDEPIVQLGHGCVVDLDHARPRQPMQLQLVAQAIRQALDVGVVAHPVQRVAILQEAAARMRQPEVVPQLVHCDHDLEVLAEDFASVAHRTLRPDPRHALRAGRRLLRRDGVHQVVVAGVIHRAIPEVPIQRLHRTIVQAREWPTFGFVSPARLRESDDLWHHVDRQLQLSPTHLPERLRDPGEDPLPVVARLQGLLAHRLLRDVSLHPIHDDH
mmetsp:Transcript_53800/g.155264  ORF Transcript_53800/g.155264 Transcript_53800/m.155264 type:complete len:927 (+) Transcript_53800:241-3021(+)